MPKLTKQDFLGRRGDEYRKLIGDFDKKQLTPVGYDFRAGECINLTLGTRVDLKGGGVFQIHHGDYVIIVTRETLNLGGRDDIFGQVFSKVSFALRGLSHVGTKIDPGFEGPLAVTFKNEGYDIIDITGDSLICNVALEIIPPSGEKYSLATYHYPTVTERPPLPLPLREDHWVTHKLGRWYSREEFQTYLQWSRELFGLSQWVGEQYAESESRFLSKLANESAKIDNEYKALRDEWSKYQSEVQDKIDRADRIYTGAVLTIFIAMIAVIGVLISSAALFFNEIKVQASSISNLAVYVWGTVSVLVSLMVVTALYKLLARKSSSNKPRGSSETAKGQ